MRSGELCTQNADCGEEAVELSYHDVSVDNLTNPKEVQVRLKKSKTDMLCQGVLIHVGRTDDDLCPVAILLSWMVSRGNKPGPLFHFTSGRPLSRPTFVAGFRQALLDAEINPKGYSGHSFWSGASTTAALKGILDCNIKKLGRWKSTAYLRYIQPSPFQLASFSKTLLVSSKESANNCQGKSLSNSSQTIIKDEQ